MQAIELDIEVKDNRPEYADRAPWHILGSDAVMYLDGRWGTARTRREIVEHAREIAMRYRRNSDYTMTLLGYAPLGVSQTYIVGMGRIKL